MAQLHQLSIDSVLQVAGNPVNAAETVAVFLPNGLSVSAGQVVTLEGNATLTTGATTTAIAARIRRTPLVGGALVGGAATLQSAAAVLNSVSIQVLDIPGEVAGQQYCLTLQQTAGSANGAIVYCSLTATWNA